MQQEDLKKIRQWANNLPNPEWWEHAPRKAWKTKIKQMEAEIAELKKELGK